MLQGCSPDLSDEVKVRMMAAVTGFVRSLTEEKLHDTVAEQIPSADSCDRNVKITKTEFSPQFSHGSR